MTPEDGHHISMMGYQSPDDLYETPDDIHHSPDDFYQTPDTGHATPKMGTVLMETTLRRMIIL